MQGVPLIFESAASFPHPTSTMENSGDAWLKPSTNASNCSAVHT